MPDNRRTALARNLRRASTEAEARLWTHLRARRLLGFKFRRQLPIGPYIADFACEQARLIIELDGGQHADSPSDDARTTALQAAGYQVLRFWNHDVLANTDGVLEEIARTLRLASNPLRLSGLHLSPQTPSPWGEGRGERSQPQRIIHNARTPHPTLSPQERASHS